MNPADYMNLFWKEDSLKPFSLNETRLYFFLLSRWTNQGDGKPFECSTHYLETHLLLPKMTITRCREKLMQRGMIQYTKGNRKVKNPFYFLCGVTNDVTNHVTNDVTKAKEEIPPTPPKEENNIYNNQQQLHAHACEKNLEELKESLMKADIWIESTRLELLRNYKIVMTEDEIKEKLSDYFVHLHSEGIEVKTEQDAKSHFKNWIAKVHEIETKKQKDAERIQRNNSRVSSKPSFNNYDEAEARHVGKVESFEF